MDLARRVCDASKSICDLLASRVLLKAMRNDDLIRSPDVSDPAIFTRFSMGVTEQMAHFARLDAISAQIDEWEGLPAATNTSKSNSRSKKNLLEDTNQSVDAEDEVVIHTNVVLNAFNEQRFSSAIDVAKLCDQDKQTFRPIFRHVPKLQEVVKQIEALVEADKTPKPLDSNGAQLTDLLRRLNQVFY